MDLLDLLVKIGVDDQASGKVDGIAGGIEGKLGKAAAAGFVNLKGHRSVGGMRASIYNAMPVEGVKKLVEVMKAFEKENA